MCRPKCTELIVQQIPCVVFDLFRFVGSTLDMLLRFHIDGIEIGRRRRLGRTLRVVAAVRARRWRRRCGARGAAVTAIKSSPVVWRRTLTDRKICVCLKQPTAIVHFIHLLWVIGIVVCFITPAAELIGRLAWTGIAMRRRLLILVGCRWAAVWTVVTQWRAVAIGWRRNVTAGQWTPAFLAQIANLLLIG